MPNRFHILVVDDEPVQREMVAGFLKKQVLEVTAADSAERALELFRQEAFDLVLTDQKMANMSGLELLQAVHTINPETPVILITAFGTIEAAVAALKQGAIDYLTKPLNLDELLFRNAIASKESSARAGRCLKFSLWCAGWPRVKQRS
jgi:DNA-binding NtrC family response regulator